MSIFSRTRDIIAANVTDLIDRAEDPAKTIRIVIMEMEETLVEVRAGAARSIADMKEKRRQTAVISGLQAQWTDRAELALEKGRDDLARAALMEKQKLAGMAGELEDEIAAIEGTLKASEADIAKLQAKLREARTRQAAVANRIAVAERQAKMREMVSGPKTEAAFSNFELLERRADLVEGHAEALQLAAPRSLEDEIAELRVAERVDAELEAMKAARKAA